MSTALVVEAWNRLERWCLARHPELLGELNPGATESQIDTIERTTDRPLPDDVRTSLLRHNGQPLKCRTGFLFGVWQMLPSESIVDEWNTWQGCLNDDYYASQMSSHPDGAIALQYFDPGWIPLTADGCGNCLGVDLTPGAAGHYGQVINFGKDEYSKGVLASSWGELLTHYANLLDSGLITEIDPAPRYWVTSFESAWGAYPTGENLVQWIKDGRWPVQ